MSHTIDNDVLKALRERRSVRSFLPEQISDGQLLAVLEAGTFAPTGKNRQDPWMVAVQKPELLAKLREMNAAVLGKDVDPYYGAPTVILVFGSNPSEWRNSVQDASLVLGNMMNAAHSVGLGSCWINREMEMFSTPEGRELVREFGLPEDVVGIGALSIGIPNGDIPPARPRKEGYYRIIR